MKRSEINKNLEWAKKLLDSRQIKLPPFGYWKLPEWQRNLADTAVIREVMLGWDITDFGNGRFDEFGAVLFTLRNGSLKDGSMGTPYAEKLIVLKDGQRLPLHCHASKTEDIINRAGGVLAIKLYNSLPGKTPMPQPDQNSPVTVFLDGMKRTAAAGQEILVMPGESITLVPFMYHLFWAKEGKGDLVCGEVSSINDDKTDNYNAEPVSRFSTVEEDEVILHPLCNEYEKVLGRAYGKQ